MPHIQRKGIIIGIDPDLEKSGIGIIRLESRTLEVDACPFPALIAKIRKIYGQADKDGRFEVVVEAGWMNRGNWHVTESRNGKFSPQAWAAAVGTSQGECNAVSKLIIQTLEYEGIPVKAQRPLRKCWRGRDRKITHAELAKECEIYRINFKDKRSNQEERDAALLALVSM